VARCCTSLGWGCRGTDYNPSVRDVRAIERSLIAWAVGSLVGALSLVAEVLVGPASLSAGGLATYSLLGGTVAVVSRSLLAGLVSADAARAGALGALAIFGSLYGLYHVNVHLLPSEHFLSRKSLCADALVVAPMLAVALSLARARWAQETRDRWGRSLAELGVASFLAGLVTAVAATPRPAADPERHGKGPDLLLVVLDSLRGDRLPPGSAHPATPEISKLASQGRVYASAWAASSWTLPSVTEILSASAPGERATLAERLAMRGYRTAVFTDNPHLPRGAPVLRGFDRVERSVGAWRNLVRGTSLGEALERLLPGSDERLAMKALAWMRRQPGPFFLYVHLMDSHTPYRFPPLDGQRRPGRRIEFPRTGMRLTQAEGESIRARYDGGIHSADARVGTILAAAEARGKPFVAIVTSDHGESLGEDGRWFHGGSLAPELLAVPLVIMGAGVEAAVISSPVGHAAITATLLAAASVPGALDAGPDLRREVGHGLAQGGLPPRLAYRLNARYKLVLDLETGHRSLYDRRADPAEHQDIAARAPQLVEMLALGLTADSRRHAPAKEQLDRLRALGYGDF
jgi:arylsulfatase A-like enzyme